MLLVVIIAAAAAISPGTAAGGWRIMHTMGHRVAKLEPVHGFAAERIDALEVLKWRDLYREIEDAIDAGDDAAETIERMLHKTT